MGSGADHKVGVYNTPPELTILSPEAGASFEKGALIELDAMVRDSQDDSDELSVGWSSQIDGFLGDDPPSQSGEVYLGISELTAGEHVVTLTVLDTQGDSAQTSVNFSVGEVVTMIRTPTPLEVPQQCFWPDRSVATCMNSVSRYSLLERPPMSNKMPTHSQRAWRPVGMGSCGKVIRMKKDG